MAELLSQSQIDELLGLAQKNEDMPVVSESEAEARRVRKYDFYSPKKINKKRLKFLDSIYESYARTVSSHMTSLLRLGCTVEVVSIEEQRYYEFNNALGENDILSIINLEFQGSQQESHLLFQISNQSIMSAVDRLLGGPGDPEDMANNSYTDIELAVYESVIKKISALAKDAWANYMDIDFNYYRYETNPRLIQTISFDEIVVIIVLSITIKDTVGNITICLPSDVLSAIFDEFDKESQVQNPHKKAGDPRATDEIIYNIKNSDLEITANLGSTHILMADLFSMQLGDVIHLNKPQESDVLLYIEGKPWFSGKLGVYKQNKAIMVQNGCDNTKNNVGGEV